MHPFDDIYDYDDELKKMIEKDDLMFGRESEAMQAWGVAGRTA